MKMYNVRGEFVHVDVRGSCYPIKFKSKSCLQGKVGSWLTEKFPREEILEEFSVPGSRYHVDFFVPGIGLVIEINGDQHYEHIPHFHGNKLTSTKFAKQIGRDRKIAEWAEVNGFLLVEIQTEKDLEKINVQ